MAPNRKKKKAPANPARGFATVSVPSKQKTATPAEPTQPESVSKEASVTPKGPSEEKSQETSSAGGKQELHQLSPEELEKHLEEAELLSLVEKYASKSKTDASRQVVKLETERRVLRPQAQPLSLVNWLPQELLDEILEKERYELRNPQSAFNGYGNESSKLVSEEEMCSRLWTLQQTLLELGFPESKVDEALKNVPISSDTTSGRDSIPCLDQAMEWLAMNCDESELPQYGERKQVPAIADIQTGKSGHTCPIFVLTFPDIDSKTDSAPSGAVTPVNSGLTTPKPVQSKVPTPLCSSEESEFDDDPQSLTPKYVSILSRMYKLQPGLFNAPKGKSKKSKRGKEPTPGMDPKVARLQQKLKKIANDVLFDADQAEEEWQSKLEELRMETEVSRQQKPDASKSEEKEQQPEAESQSQEEEHEAGGEDDLGLLGDMFAAEEPSANETPLLGIPLNTSSKQRDFGKTSGMNPRRILEEACRARFVAMVFSSGTPLLISFTK